MSKNKKFYFLASLIYITPVVFFSDDIKNSNNLLKDSKRDFLEKSREQINASSKAISNLWLGGLNLETSYNFFEGKGISDNYPNFSATISQDIFRSGGISYQIEKGKIVKTLNMAILNKNERELIFNLYNIVLNLKKLDVELKKQKLSIKNQKLIIQNQEDSYLKGVINLVQLDQSIIELNNMKNIEENILSNRIDLISSLKDITDLSYDQINISKFVLPKYDDFINKNIDLDIGSKEVMNLEIDKNLAYTQYLPKLSLFGAYQWENSKIFTGKEDSYKYGLKLTIPISFNFSDAIETAQITYLQAKSKFADSRENQNSIYYRAIDQLKSIERKVKNNLDAVKSYEKILDTTEAYYKHNLKTADDVEMLKNRVKIIKYDSKIYELEQELAKLSVIKLMDM